MIRIVLIHLYHDRNHDHHHRHHTHHVQLWQLLTGLVGGDVYRDMLGRVWAPIADSIDSLNLEAIEGVSQQVADEHPGLSESQLSRDKLHVVIAVGAGAPVSSALLAHDVVDHVIAAARLPGRVPLQDHWSLIHNGDNIPRTRWHTCGHGGNMWPNFFEPRLI